MTLLAYGRCQTRSKKVIIDISIYLDLGVKDLVYVAHRRRVGSLNYHWLILQITIYFSEVFAFAFP